MTTYTPETKAAVLADIWAGDTRGFVAQKYGIPSSTVKDWVRRARKTQPTRLAAVPRRFSLMPEDLGSRVDELLASNLETLRAIGKLAQNEEWLQKQEANALGVLYGILYDKTERILSFRRLSAKQEAG